MNDFGALFLSYYCTLSSFASKCAIFDSIASKQPMKWRIILSLLLFQFISTHMHLIQVRNAPVAFVSQRCCLKLTVVC